MNTRKVIFPPADYWTNPPKENQVTTSELSDEQFGQRVRALLEHAVASLSPDDYTARVTYCRDNNCHGIRMHPGDDGLLEFRWGGRRLAMVHADTLNNDRPVQFGFVNDQPTDIVPPEWTQQ